MPVDSLYPGESPRIGVEDPQHCLVLAGIEGDLPPVLVLRSSMRIIDGMHRWTAAKQRGDAFIDVVFYDGTPEDAFVLAVQANTSHGRPLTLEERRRSANRILASHAAWSDRAIAAVCGLSAATVSALRRATAQVTQLPTRVGRDGRRRPVDTNASRREAARLLREDPSLSLRQVARATGISPGTVRDVRARLTSGRPPEIARNSDPSPPVPVGETPGSEAAGYEKLRHDSAMQATPEGRQLLEWLTQRQVTANDWEAFVNAVPRSRVYLVAAVARSSAQAWTAFADKLEARSQR